MTRSKFTPKPSDEMPTRKQLSASRKGKKSKKSRVKSSKLKEDKPKRTSKVWRRRREHVAFATQAKPIFMKTRVERLIKSVGGTIGEGVGSTDSAKEAISRRVEEFAKALVDVSRLSCINSKRVRLQARDAELALQLKAPEYLNADVSEEDFLSFISENFLQPLPRKPSKLSKLNKETS